MRAFLSFLAARRPAVGRKRVLPLLGLLVLGLPAAAAEPSYRREVLQAVQAAQEQLGAKRPAEALQQLAAVRTREDLNPDERLLTERLAGVAALQAQQPREALSALERVIAMPQLPVADRPAILDALSSASARAQDAPRTERWARACLDAGCPPERLRPLLLQALAVQGKHAELLQAFRAELAEPARLRALAEPELRMIGASQAALKDHAGYIQTLQALLARAPSRAYWGDLLLRLPGQPGFNPRLELDVYRLMLDTDTLEELPEYLDMARLALKAGLPAEAVSVLERARAKGLALDAPAAALLKQASQRSREDEQALPELQKAARDADGWAQLALLHFAAGRWSEAQAAWTRAFAAGTPRHAEEARLHQGIALLRSGQAAAARELLGKVGGDPATLARLWLLRLPAS